MLYYHANTIAKHEDRIMKTQTYPKSLTLALPKQQKLKVPIIELFNEKGFVIESDSDGETGLIKDTKGNIPDIRVEFVRARDALLLMEKKVVDFAIIGSDVANENTCGDNPAFEKPDMKWDLGIAECTFDLAVPNEKLPNFKTPQDVNGLIIATSYPNQLKEWLKEKNVEAAEIVEREGGVESSIRMGLADVVADLVDTGKTLRKNGLTSAFRIAKTSAACYIRKDADVLTNMLVDEVVRELKSKNQIFIMPAANEVTYAMA